MNWVIDEGEQVKEVCARFGVAVYQVQCLETAIVNLVAATHLSERDRFTRRDFDELTAGGYRQTLGQLVRQLRSSAAITEEDAALLEEALEVRNWLVHAYFRERAVQFCRIEGRVEMIKELDAFREIIERACVAVERRSLDIGGRFGVTDEAIARQVARILRDGDVPED